LIRRVNTTPPVPSIASQGIADHQTGHPCEIAIGGPEFSHSMLDTDRRHTSIVHRTTRDPALESQFL
jgi:hypothetical protein